MSIKIRIQMLWLFSLLFCLCTPTYAKKSHTVIQEQPKLTVVLVIDQFAYSYIRKLQPFFKYGLKNIFDQGIVYTNAYFPHATPETAPGHNTLSTGTLPKDHGAITNQWLDKKGNKVSWESDVSGSAALLIPDSDPAKGKSDHNTMVDGLSDQFVFHTKGKIPNKVFSIALKSYPSIAMANKLGKAIWFEADFRGFTSSKSYFPELPVWISTFNNSEYMKKLRNSRWQLLYTPDDPAYNFPYAKNHDFAGLPFSLIGHQCCDAPKDITPAPNATVQAEYVGNKPYELFTKTPMASEVLLKLAQECIRKNLSQDDNHQMLLWISLSNFDLAGHIYGPDSIELIDMTYHIDKQIKEFIDFVEQYVGKNNYLLVFTADHGVAPFPELQQLRGYPQARRIMAKELIEKINAMIKQQFSIENLVLGYEPSSFRLDMDKLNVLPEKQRQKILKKITQLLKEQPGIKHAWTYDELKNETFAPNALENFQKNQLYRTRTGKIICQTEPYCFITHYPKGTSHATPYDYDTHVPLVLYRGGSLEKKTIHDRVWMPQVSVTLAKLLGIQKPSASTADPLPGIF